MPKKVSKYSFILPFRVDKILLFLSVPLIFQWNSSFVRSQAPSLPVPQGRCRCLFFVGEKITDYSTMATYKVVMVRHGESSWNKENRFCGWFDADLAESGTNEAINAGKVKKENSQTFSRLSKALKLLATYT